MPEPKAADYVAVVGFNFGKQDTRVDAGEPVPADTPAPVIRTLLEQGAIAPKKEKN